MEDVAQELAADISTAPNLMLPYVLPRLSVSDVKGQPQTTVLDAEGKPTEMSLAEFKQELSERKDLAAIIIASKASGGGAIGSGTRSSQPRREKKTLDAKLISQLGLR